MGLGNIAGVALAIVAGGPGAVFWMWISALVGVATKFFTCTLGVMYRGRTASAGSRAGPCTSSARRCRAHSIRWRYCFPSPGLIGTLPMFQANQLTALIGDTVFGGTMPLGRAADRRAPSPALVAGVIFGGLPRVAAVAVAALPSMVAVYMLMTLYVIVSNLGDVPAILVSIVREAFTPQAAGGGFVGVMLIGISRGAFSNEAGVGTEVMAHGAARTNEPIREGLVAMLGPVIDTLLVCTCTAIVILMTGQPGRTPGNSRGSPSPRMPSPGMGAVGCSPLGFVALILSTTTMFTGWYYGAKCFGFLVGASGQHHFRWFFVATVSSAPASASTWCSISSPAATA
jgi:AGCS family alanine or glycine:cation symporter